MYKLEITLRKFEQRDAAAISMLIRDNLIKINCMDYPEDIIRNMCELFTEKHILRLSNKRRIYVAVDDDVIVGTASIEDNTICTVFVDTFYHRNGIGRKLVQLMEEIAANKGLSVVKVSSSLTSQGFYEKLGYKVVGEEESEEFGREIMMEKIIL